MAQIGRYRTVSVVGFSPLSTFSLAADSNGKSLSIRSVQLGDIKDPDLRAEIARELRVAASMLPSLRHPNAECVLEVIEAGSEVHVVSERVDAPPVSGSVLQFGLAERLTGLAQLAGALEQARRLGIVHGALAPQHILGTLGASPHLVLTQFMVARTLARFIDPAESIAATLRYISPEQVEDKPLTPQSDQFSLAVLAYEWLTGMKPFEARQLPTVYFRICKEDPRLPSDLNSALDRTADNVLLRALAKRPEQRYPSAAAFVDALLEALDHRVPAIGKSTPPEVPIVRPVNVPEPPAPVPTPAALPVPPEPPVSATPHGDNLPPPTPRRRPAPPPDPEPPVPPPAFLPKSSAPLANGRTIGVTLIALLLIGGAIWVDRYRTVEPPVPVQQADPSKSPASPPPDESSKTDTNSKPAPEPPPASTTTPPPPPPAPAPPASTARSTPSPTRPAPASPRPSPSHAESKYDPLPVADDALLQPKRGANAVPPAISIRMLSIPPGARMEVDQDPQLACTAPCTLELPKGRHTLAARSSGASVARKIFNVPESREVTVVLPMSAGTLLVSSSPSGALILIDGADRGNTPASIRLSAGSHRLTVISGNRRSEETIQIESDQLLTRTYRW